MNSKLPSGTVSFLFTDIEGSTKLAQKYPDAMPALIARHNEILEVAVSDNNGHVYQYAGDSYLIAFPKPEDALKAATEAQRQLQSEKWSPAPIRVRMGLHVGFADLIEEEYRGYLTMARVQRVMSSGHGGQILLSLDFTDQVREELPPNTSLQDLGKHHLKDLNQPEHLFQLAGDNLPSNFPPLKSTPMATSNRVEGFSLLDHLVEGQLIGREKEITQLEAFWKRAEAGEGHLVLISGEPGIGKTRLVEELTALALLRGGQIMEGHFHPELGVTYLGFREALQEYLRSIPAEQVDEIIGASAPELIKLVPEVESIIGPVTPNPPMGELEAERLRLFDHVTQFLIRLAKKAPILFVLEDLHWADGPSLAFLHFLLRNTHQLPVLVVGTYRESEVDPVRPFYESLLSMNRDRLYTRVALHGLGNKIVEKFVSNLLDGPVEKNLVSAIAKDTEGNPFFMEEVVKGLVERNHLNNKSGKWRLDEEIEQFIPQSIQIALGKRLDSLSTDTKKTLSFASILGREFDTDILLFMSTLEEDPLLDALDEALKAQLIIETRAHGRDTYRFSHALLSRVIYEGINPRRRMRFHQQAGEAIESVHSENMKEQIEALAYHFSHSSASAAEKAVKYGLQAAEKAVTVYAHEQAIQQYTEVLEALHDLDDPLLEARTWELMGDANMRLYYVKEAIEAYENALNTLDESSLVKGEEFCRLSYKLGELITRELNDPGRARKYLERALSSSASSFESPLRVKCLAALAVCNVQEGNLDEAQAQAQKAIDLAEKLEFSEGLASGCGALCNVFEARGDLAAYAQTSEQQVAALDQSGDLYGIFDAYFHMIMISNRRGKYDQAEHFALEGLELCRKFNAPGWEAPILAAYIIALNYAGRWEEALKHGERVMPLFDRVGCSNCFMIIFWNLADIQAKLGNFDQSMQFINNAIDIMRQRDDPPEIENIWNFFVHVFKSEWGSAWRLVKKRKAAGYPLLGVTSTVMSMWTWTVPKVGVYADKIEEALLFTTKASELFQKLKVPYGLAKTHFAFGLANSQQKKWNEAIADFEQALNIYRELKHPWDIANTLYEIGSVYSAEGKKEGTKKAREVFGEARSLYKNLNAQPSIEKVNALLKP